MDLQLAALAVHSGTSLKVIFLLIIFTFYFVKDVLMRLKGNEYTVGFVTSETEPLSSEETSPCGVAFSHRWTVC